MIVCSCNVISDNEVRTAVRQSSSRSCKQVYGCLGCSAECGRCARTIRKIMDEAIAGATCATACACCPKTAKPNEA
ncbi:MAG: (2Fe-2S)-binding protein [Pseudolabrys sp.]|nr:(2Fe-2S)-binding protein [Pseudolabrys sp.]